ncbi:LysR family transcriptional regulator [Photobacterium sp. 1_MG-2023]|uniref:LysR family transcriptional regulator n=1 Tax=Photobacterium sp. 1_MG-2023 TaxID=3062646 RepID=UPI0026E19987|nr:LysR family transcriptional regulator [Photobacterium sp. 1_MG-2023]MDO6706884.1 LysR family transcriptional regulator [Photobacterium sp. 1_MG-2023]
MRLFVKAAACTNLTQAAEITGVPLATLSRRIKHLEDQLQCRLLNRSAHFFSLTPEGETYYMLCHPLIQELEQAQIQTSSDRQQLTGTIRITAPVNLAQVWLKECFFDFMKYYPGVQLDIEVSNQIENLVMKDFDIAFRVGELQDSDWIARRMWQATFVLCASRQYLAQHKVIEHPSQLAEHQLIASGNAQRWAMKQQNSGEQFQQPMTRSCLRVNDIHIARDAAAAGLGITWIPAYYFEADGLLQHDLIRLLPDWAGENKTIWMMYRDRIRQSARLKAFIEHVENWSLPLTYNTLKLN